MDARSVGGWALTPLDVQPARLAAKVGWATSDSAVRRPQPWSTPVVRRPGTIVPAHSSGNTRLSDWRHSDAVSHTVPTPDGTLSGVPNFAGPEAADNERPAHIFCRDNTFRCT